jgi:ABC-type phosphate transport system permease subunit
MKNSDNNVEEKYYLRRIEKENKKLNTYMCISGISILPIIISIVLYDTNLISKEIRDISFALGSTTLIADNVYYFLDKIKNLLYDQIDKPASLKRKN